MIQKKIILDNERGATLVEMLLALALAAIILPFIANFQKSRIERAENIAITREMDLIQGALERYIELNRKELLAPVGKNIVRVNIADLEDYGVPTATIEKHGDNLQVRVLKSGDASNSILQGIVVLNDKNITPMKTREIINLGGQKMGFVEEGKAIGAFGTWHANTSDLGISSAGGIVETTRTTLGEEKYLWRLPSENESDATMLSPLNLAGHNIINAKFADSRSAQFEEILKSEKIVANKITFQNRTTVDNDFTASDVVVSGTLSADSRGLNVTNTLTLADTAKFSGFTVDEMWTHDLNLSGLSITNNNGSSAATLKVNQTIDMVAGRVTAMYASVGFTGSVTPKLTVSKRIEDTSDSRYFWDVSNSSDASAQFYDMSLAELTRMAPIISAREDGSSTISGQIFGRAAANKNATASDFMNVISQIQERVRAKYRNLNLE